MRKGQSIEGGVATQSAMRYSNQKAEQILREPQFGVLRDRMVTLFTEDHLTSLQIAEAVVDDMQLRAGVKIQTASSIVRRVLAALVDDGTRSEVHSILQANALDRRRDDIDAARDGWMLDQGYKVWTDEEDAYFLRLIKRPSMKRGTSDICNHKKIAEAMCKKFGPGTFDADRCRRHLESIRRIGHISQSTVKRLRGKRGVLPAPANRRRLPPF